MTNQQQKSNSNIADKVIKLLGIQKYMNTYTYSRNYITDFLDYKVIYFIPRIYESLSVNIERILIKNNCVFVSGNYEVILFSNNRNILYKLKLIQDDFINFDRITELFIPDVSDEEMEIIKYYLPTEKEIFI